MSQLVDEIVASAGTTSSGVLGNSIDMEKTFIMPYIMLHCRR